MQTTRTRVDLASLGVLDNLASPPVVAMEILRLGRDPDTGLDDLAEVLSHDPALSAKVIRVANAAAYRRRGDVVSVADAATRLGLRTLEVIALGFSLLDDMPKAGEVAGMSMNTFWQRSLDVAVLSRVIAEQCLPRQTQEAFVVGLFTHLGRLVLAQHNAGSYAPVVGDSGGWPSIEFEQQRLGYSNLDVGAAVLETWGLPMVIVDGLLDLAGAPSFEQPAGEVDLPTVLRAALLADRVLYEPGTPPGPVALDDAAESLLGAGNDAEALLAGASTAMDEACDLFDVDSGSVDPAAMLAESRSMLVDASIELAEDLQTEEQRSRVLGREIEELQARVREDSLTRLPNRAALEEFLRRELDLRRRGSRDEAIGVLLVDIDHFKMLNDDHGHQVGDDVLRLVAATLSSGCRRGELLARYGGEEFVLVAPACTVGDLFAAGERLREDVEQLSLEVGDTIVSVTVSIGGACARDAELFEDGDRLIQKADGYLYRAKRRGRNRTEICPEDLL